jgi:uncharacterized protein (DUF488 family)
MANTFFTIGHSTTTIVEFADLLQESGVFRNYAEYALTASFAAGIARLRERGSGYRCAMMCAEAVWWRCHRRIIADYLLAAGERVMHILGTSHVDEAHLTPGSVLRNDGTVVYPAESSRPG